MATERERKRERERKAEGVLSFAILNIGMSTKLWYYIAGYKIFILMQFS